MALFVRTPWLSVNSGTDVARFGTRDARRQFRDCPGNSGTVGNPTVYGKCPLMKKTRILPSLKHNLPITRSLVKITLSLLCTAETYCGKKGE